MKEAIEFLSQAQQSLIQSGEWFLLTDEECVIALIEECLLIAKSQSK